jgi:hypothetical protein
MHKTMTWTGLLLAMWATTARAQGADPDSVRHRNNCRLAQQVLETGQPAPKRQWAITYAAGCGSAGAQALAAAIRRERASTDVGALELLHMPAQGIRDRAIFEAALEVAADARASGAARAMSLGALVLYESAEYPALTYQELTSVPEGGLCAFYRRWQARPTLAVGEPLLPDHLERTRVLAERLVGDDAAPREVRSAARCVLEGLRKLAP